MNPTKRGIFRLLILVVLGLLVYWMVQGLQNSLIITRDGKSILATEVWEGKSGIMYIYGGMVKTLPAGDVSKIIQGSLADPSCYYPLLSQYLRVSLAKAADLIPPGVLAKIRNHPYVNLAKPHLPLIACAFLVLLLLLICFRGWRRHRRQKDLARSGPDDEALLHLVDFSDVESLFLSLFKKKLGAPESAPSKINRDPRPDKRPGRLLDLRVFHEDKWHTRRMTLAPIGEGSGSKSQCFYVIFDTHMVIKIPSAPITDFEDYIARVQAEAKIMQRLAPRICVTPNLAVILGRIHPFSDVGTTPPEFIENRYIRWLREHPENQRFLTIGGNFVFFMDLARYYFLSHVTAGFHSLDAGLEKEVGADIDILTDVSAFEGKYGRRGAELWPALYKAYDSYHKELQMVIARAGAPVSLSDRKIKELFLSSIADGDSGLAELNLPADLGALLKKLLAQTAQSEKVLKQHYREVLVHYTEQRLFTRSKPMMGGMVTNLLGMLDWAGEKKVSLRDLKPDNLLVAGNPGNYPQFLSSPGEYTIGLIDLETAVYFGNSRLSKIPQPQLGGTPFYCTPSHFFPNALLEEVYGDLPLVLHLQDWYAMMAIIFEVVTGDKLFKATARQMPVMMKSILQTLDQEGDLETEFLHFTRRFQDNVHRETRAKFELYADRLQAVSARITANIQKELLEYHQAELTAQREELNRFLDSHSAFNESGNRKWIDKSSIADLEKLRGRYQKRKGGDKLTESIGQVIRFRTEIDTLTAHIRKLTGPVPRISIRTLLEMMFALIEKKLLTDLALPAPDPASEIPATEVEPTGDTEILDYTATIPMEEMGVN